MTPTTPESLGLEFDPIHAFEFTQSLPPSLENTLRTNRNRRFLFCRPGASPDRSPNTFDTFAESFAEGDAARLCHL